MSKPVKCTDRILSALRLQDMTVAELSNALFVDRNTIRGALDTIMLRGTVKRVGVHSRKSGRPEYRYSLIAPSTLAARADRLKNVIGDWDAA